MTEENYEGSLILEKLAEIGKLDEFYELIDSDDFEKISYIMREAGFNSETIRITLEKISDGEEI